VLKPRSWLCGAVLPVFLALPSLAFAQDASEDELTRLRAVIAEQQRQLEAQQRTLDELSARIEALGRESEQETLPTAVLDEARAGQAPEAEPAPDLAAPVTAPPQQQAAQQPPAEVVQERRALPENASVLTPAGHLLVEPSLELVNASTNRLVFRGIEIVTGLQIGVIEANDADRDAVSAALTVRYGLTDRLEVELRAPYLYRHDRVTTLAQRDDQIIREFDTEGDGFGDVEGALRYQINGGADGGPIYIANLRVKSDTGSSPFEIARDEFGVLTELPTGTGFWAVEPSLTVLVPSDPVVIYGSLSYLWHLADDVDTVIGDVLIGEVDPGDSLGASIGFGFALNSQFSFSLGYKHNYIYPTETEFGPTLQRSDPLQVGALLLGLAYQVNNHLSLNTSFEFGATEDASDIRILIRAPVIF
jgi:hypothetical protein